ncbi:MAG: response regulator [Chloroflexi bacterium]|nr:response regulator [Chloroflexota bacterium]
MRQDPPRALVVEDDPSWQAIVSEILADMGLGVDVADSLNAAVISLRAAAHRLAVVDLSLGGADHHNQDGLAVLDAIRRQDPGCVAILLTGFATVELAVNALTVHGARSCLRKETFRRAEFRTVVHQALAIAPQTFEVSENLKGLAADLEGLADAGALALVVEDDAGWRGILAELLAEAGVSARSCSSYGEALGLLRREKFALAVVDLSLASSVAPDGNLDGARILANTRAAAIPTLVVSGAAAPAAVERVYAEHGIFAYLEKQKFDRGAFRRIVGEILSSARGPSGEVATLTEREREVLELLAQGMTNKEMATRLVITTNTVKRHLKSIFEKLQVNTRAAAAAKAVQKPGF